MYTMPQPPRSSSARAQKGRSKDKDIPKDQGTDSLTAIGEANEGSDTGGSVPPLGAAMNTSGGTAGVCDQPGGSEKQHPGIMVSKPDSIEGDGSVTARGSDRRSSHRRSSGSCGDLGSAGEEEGISGLGRSYADHVIVATTLGPHKLKGIKEAVELLHCR